jgi:cyclophilin family peptidyl-prolyl cis-trans isomerase
MQAVAETTPLALSAGERVELSIQSHFGLPPVWVMETSDGAIPIQLTPQVAPLTVANFVEYAQSGRYENSFIHRSVPGFVVQGGGFFLDEREDGIFIEPVPTFDPVVNEPNVSNRRGTVAMAKLGGDPDSATSQWFFNLVDNGAILDDQNGGFTVFGEVIGNGMTVVDAIAGIPVYDASEHLGAPFGQLPLREPELIISSLVTINRVIPGVPDVSITFVEGNAEELEVSVLDGNLIFDAVSAAGHYEIEITVSYYGGTESKRLFQVNVASEPQWYDNALELANGWRFFDWFKSFRPTPNDWIFHSRHGWLHVKGESTQELYLWDAAAQRWLWTNETVYPWMYTYGQNEGWDKAH